MIVFDLAREKYELAYKMKSEELNQKNIQLEKKAREFCTKHRINASFKGFIKNVNAYLSDCDFVFVSRYLGILEALSFEKFIFANHNNAIKKDYLEMTPFAKFISISKDFEELSNQIEYYLKNGQKRNKMIEGGFDWVKAQDWDKVITIYLRLWSKN